MNSSTVLANEISIYNGDISNSAIHFTGKDGSCGLQAGSGPIRVLEQWNVDLQ